ncbi:alpha-amylase/alpha-mannosidase [Planctomicrobium sp. SH664]|uniref:alpha-amylase/alpha-mannosidase n=1 Tax=Planctomicrobium sp. SH664 TaxID=3448125 RepID=UPI003F5C0598
MQPVALALFWHQHQPYYPDDVTGETLMPWVRLHGTKDYIGMALHVKEVPEFRCSMNLVPSLLLQIERYLNGGSDRQLDVSRLPADSLSQADAYYLLDHFFMANEATMIRPFPRYHELYQRRALGRESAAEALHRFNAQDLRDLQVWNNLTWIHELVFERDHDLQEFRQKGRDYTEKEKTWLLKRQLEILGDVIPLHRELAEGGQLELTTTPFYHPILPLLWDKKCAREGMPGCPLPRYTQAYREDVARHIQKAVQYHIELFGIPPRGMWPSEGSVSQEIIAPIAEAGIEWIATDEEILTHSTDGFVHRDGAGLVNRPEMLYRPWRVEQEGKPLQILFRDHGLSDLIGFHYQRNDARWAAGDLLGKVKEIGRSVATSSPERPALVPIILDGENCWEYYPDGGVSFLRNLYRQAAHDKDIAPMRVSEYLAKYPAVHKIGRLFAGSWINHDFYIWIGHQDDRDAWDLVHITREFLIKAEKSNKFSKEVVQRAWDEMMIAEGSDWFWWYGDDHNSAQDALFDELFRRHLRNVYTLFGEAPPSALLKPVARAERRHIHTSPRAFVNARVDGRISYFEWLNAGHYEAGSERGTMTMVSDGTIRHIYFGFNHESFFVRIDTPARAAMDLQEYDELKLRFIEPYGTEIHVRFNAGKTPTVAVTIDHKDVKALNCQASLDKVLEVAVPWKALGVDVGQRLHMAAELVKGNEVLERTPSEGTIDLAVPSPDFEMHMWQA